jgi:hypothetical protein
MPAGEWTNDRRQSAIVENPTSDPSPSPPQMGRDFRWSIVDHRWSVFAFPIVHGPFFTKNLQTYSRDHANSRTQMDTVPVFGNNTYQHSRLK